jgi:hypothetical protein
MKINFGGGYLLCRLRLVAILLCCNEGRVDLLNIDSYLDEVLEFVEGLIFGFFSCCLLNAAGSLIWMVMILIGYQRLK